MGAIHYWNQTAFQGLLKVAAAADARGLGAFADYCRLRESGLRTKALASLRAFIQDVLRMEEGPRRETVAWLADLCIDNPGIHYLNVRPLTQLLIEPVLGTWGQESADLRPRRLVALLHSDAGQLREVLRVDAGDSRCRTVLVQVLLRAVDYACHHLVEGHFLGSEEAAKADLDEVCHHILQLPAGAPRDHLQRAHDELRLLLEDWTEFQTQGSGDFPQWCARRQHHHRWWSVVYQGRARDREVDPPADGDEG